MNLITLQVQDPVVGGVNHLIGQGTTRSLLLICLSISGSNFFLPPLKKPFPRPFALVGFGALPDKVHEILLALQEVYQLFGKREFINDDNSDELINIPDG